MRRIARQIGYSATSIYLHYENKDQLVHALIDEGVGMLHDRLAKEVVPGEPEATLRALCAAYAAFGLEYPEYYEIMYILHTEYIERYPAEKYRRARQNLEFFARALMEGAENGVFDGVQPLLGSTVIWAQLHGAVSLINGHRIDRKIEQKTLLGEVIERIVRSQKSLK
jgi:AcrR family transcriptional regulator